MMKLKLIHVVLSLCLTLQYANAATNEVTCYYEREAEYSFAPEDIDVSICTHINYAFLGINHDGTLRLNGADDILKRLGNLKQKNPNLKLLLSVGGWDEGSEKFSHVAGNAAAKISMANDVLLYMQMFNFDGVDIDWEYPGQRLGTPADKENFIDMLGVVRNTLNDNGGGLITVTVSPVPDPDSYNVQAISQVVDGINVMTYNFHGSYDNKTGENSPLYASHTDSDWERQNSNCDASINNWLNSGADPQKVALGLGFYGHSYTLSDPNQHGVGAPSNGDGLEGGTVSYAEICTLDWTEGWDDEQEVPYKYSENQWVGYDNPQSIALKMQYAKSRNLAGVMVWAVDNDDNAGACGHRNALLQAIRDNL